MKLWERFRSKPQGNPLMSFKIRVTVDGKYSYDITVRAEGEVAEVNRPSGRIVVFDGDVVHVFV